MMMAMNMLNIMIYDDDNDDDDDGDGGVIEVGQ